MSTLEMIVEDLRTLPPPKLEEAASYIHRLKEAASAERMLVLERTAGAWGGSEGAEIEKAIEDGCERIDPRDW